MKTDILWSMSPLLSQPFVDLDFMGPLSEQRAERLVKFLAEGLGAGVVLDLGCGWAELLLRVVEAAAGSRGVGVDADGASIAHGREVAHQRGLADRVTLIHGDAKEHSSGQADALLCLGASQIWGPPVQDRRPLDYSAALGALRAMVTRGARVVYGESIWSQPPTTAAVAHLSGRTDELVMLPELVELAVTERFMPMAIHQATIDEWDAFESGYGACYARWLAEHDVHHPDAESIRTSAARQRQAYLEGYRGVLGLGYLELVAI